MSPVDQLAAILAAVQGDPGNRGLARDPDDNLLTATCGDFAAACHCIADQPRPMVGVWTGFIIPTAEPPAYETDGPLGAVFLARAAHSLGLRLHLLLETGTGYDRAIEAGLNAAGIGPDVWYMPPSPSRRYGVLSLHPTGGKPTGLVLIAVERAGPAADGRCYTLRGHDITDLLGPPHETFLRPRQQRRSVTIGIGDGGNEIGMGKIPHETVVKNIPNGQRIHCRVATDHLIVAGVSNWGAYALAAGLFVLRRVKPPAHLFDPTRERTILQAMVQAGPLVDGVSGEPTATVDGLTWDQYVRPLVRISEIVEAR